MMIIAFFIMLAIGFVQTFNQAVLFWKQSTLHDIVVDKLLHRLKSVCLFILVVLAVGGLFEAMIGATHV